MANVLLALWLSTVTGASPDTVVVCPEEFRQTLAPWLELRAEQGHRVQVFLNGGSSEEIRRRILAACKREGPRFIVLIGDVPQRDSTAADLRRTVPTHHAAAKVNVAWGSPPHIATDNRYADFDGDELPDAAVGRLSVRSSDELAAVVRKIVEYERQVDYGDWRRRVNLVAGNGGFGPLADAAIETATRQLLNHGIPAAYRTSMTYANWRSAYFPGPSQLRASLVERLNEGCLFWVYMGHGLPDQLVDVSGENPAASPLFTCGDAAGLHRTGPMPIAILLACYTGAMDARGDCLAEEMLRSPGGPVAVIAGSRVTMPYGLAVLGSELMDQHFVERRATLGETLLQAKRKALLDESAKQSGRRQLLDAVASLISPQPADLAAERKEHVQMLNLLGDPLLRMRHPHQVALQVQLPDQLSHLLRISGTCAIDGVCRIELATPRDRLLYAPADRKEADKSPAALAEYQRVYQAANDGCRSSVETTVHNGRFSADLPVSAEVTGPHQVRVFVEGRGDFALGCRQVTIPARQPISAGR